MIQKPLLSIGMIVKNEIRCIERCLKSLQPLRDAMPCELVIADTGSDDGTREVVERYADVLFDFPWVSDFSAARNAVMDRCHGEWYFSIDADEWLDPDVHIFVNILTDSNKNQRFDGFHLTVRNYHLRDIEHSTYSDCVVTRFLRMSTGIRYSGKIHEHWDAPESAIFPLLEDAVIHHDGYSYVNQAEHDKKEQRNMELLREEYLANPQDRRTVIHCIDSSCSQPVERLSYIFHGMDLVMKSEGVPSDRYTVGICKHGISFAAKSDLPQFEEWLTWASEHIAGAPALDVDIAYTAAKYYFQKQKFEQALEWIKHYQQGMIQYTKREYNPQYVGATSLVYINEANQSELECLKGQILWQLGDTQAAIQCIQQIDPLPQDASGESIYYYFQALKVLTDTDVVQELTKTLYQRLQVLNDVDASDPWGEKLQKDADGIGYALLNNDEKEYWKMFLSTEGPLGDSARMLIADPETLSNEVSKIENWDKQPVRLLGRMVQNNISFPASFFQCSATTLATRATAILKGSSTWEILEYVRHEKDNQNLNTQQFLLHLLVGGIQKSEMFEMDALCQLYFELIEPQLKRLYHPDVLAEDSLWYAIPDFHCFACYLLRGKTALEQGDRLTWIRDLRTALKIAPVMKEMVNYLMDHPPVMTVNNELSTLAEQVQKLLSMYSPDDPAVLSLKASPVYQRVAHLLPQ